MSTILTVLKYDFRRFFRDWLMVTFSVVMLVIYVAVALFVPRDISPTWRIAATESSAEPLRALIEREMEEDAELELKVFGTEEELKKAFEEGEEDFFVGIALDEDARSRLARGEKPAARVYVDESSPPDVQETARAIGAMMVMAAFLPQTAEPREPELLGPRVDEVDFKERMKGLMAVTILLMEMLALASLMSREVSSGVVHAVLTTTVSLPRYFAAKMVFGVVLAFSQAALVTAAVGALASGPLIILAQLFLGATMFTAMGIIAGMRGAHLMEVLMYAMIFMFPNIIPVFAIMLPGTPPLVVQALPSYPVIQGVISAGQASPLHDPWLLLGWSAAWAAGTIAVAYAALRWRVK